MKMLQNDSFSSSYVNGTGIV